MPVNTGEKTAGIIIIGDEILSGRVCETNGYFLASELWDLGVRVKRISTIPDEIETIATEVAAFSRIYDFVFTSGGIGPTHDDRTIESVAKGFGVRVVRHPALERYLRTRYGGNVNDALLKMAEVPDGAEVMEFVEGGLPLIVFRNVFILPGIPEYLRKKFSFVRDRFRSHAFYLRRIFLNANESDIAAPLDAVARSCPDIAFGSYPILGNPEYRVIITAESRDEEILRRAVGELLGCLPDGCVVRVE